MVPPPPAAPTVLRDHGLPFAETLPYDPTKAGGLELIRSKVAIEGKSETLLHQNGFVILPKREPNFFLAYTHIYRDHLPLFISADSILNVLHLSYDRMLADIERDGLRADLQTALASARARLSSGSGKTFSSVARADVDLYLAVAESLLLGKPSAPVAGATPAAIAQWLEVIDAKRVEARELWGTTAIFDTTQLVPRGHYDNPALKPYFQAYMWLTRAELPIVVSTADGARRIDRRGLAGALVLAATLDEPARAALGHLIETRRMFVGAGEEIDPAMLLSLQKAFALDSAAAVNELDDAAAVAWIGSKVHPSPILTRPALLKKGPPEIPFSLVGQAATIDGEVLSAVLGRAEPEAPVRPLPNGLDVAFAALRNDQAWTLLREELDTYRYGAKLEAERVRLDGKATTVLSASLYDGWISALRELSPTKDVGDPRAVGLPSVAATEAWGRRILNTQLASYAELRHDTILYVKPSYSVIMCEFPTAYVDPYPELYARVADYARRGRSLVTRLSIDPETRARIDAYFGRLESAATTLRDIATAQRKGQPLSPEHLAFVNDAVSVKTVGCGSLDPEAGWFKQLYYEEHDALSAMPTVADVATDPDSGQILHVATGYPHLMVMTAETCDGPRAFVGIASEYVEKISTKHRYSDKEWVQELGDEGVEQHVPWMAELRP